MDFISLGIAAAGLGLSYYQGQQQNDLQAKAIKAQNRANAVSAGRQTTLIREVLIVAAVAVGIYLAVTVVKAA